MIIVIHIYLLKEIVANTEAGSADPNNNNKKVILKNCAPFIDCRSEKDNTQLDNAKDIDMKLPMIDLI